MRCGEELEAEFAVGWLAAALAGPGAVFIVEEVDRWGGEHFVYVATRDTGAV